MNLSEDRDLTPAEARPRPPGTCRSSASAERSTSARTGRAPPSLVSGVPHLYARSDGGSRDQVAAVAAQFTAASASPWTRRSPARDSAVRGEQLGRPRGQPRRLRVRTAERCPLERLGARPAGAIGAVRVLEPRARRDSEAAGADPLRAWPPWVQARGSPRRARRGARQRLPPARVLPVRLAHGLSSVPPGHSICQGADPAVTNPPPDRTARCLGRGDPGLQS